MSRTSLSIYGYHKIPLHALKDDHGPGPDFILLRNLPIIPHALLLLPSESIVSLSTHQSLIVFKMTSTTVGPISTRTTPMSGVFTPPSSCSSHWTYEAQAANSVTGGLLLQNAWAGQDDTPCHPPGFCGWGRAPSYIQIFSPGVCPSGYTTANNNYNGPTTTAVCCLRHAILFPYGLGILLTILQQVWLHEFYQQC